MKAKKFLGLSVLAALMLAGCNNGGQTSSQPSSGDTSSAPTATSTSQPAQKELVGIELDTSNVKKAYELGAALDLSGLAVKAVYSDESKEAVTDFSATPASGTVLNEIGTVSVKVSYQGKEASFDVTVAKTVWTAEEEAIMKEHLYGEVLPFNGLAESVVSYVESDDYVKIAGGELTALELAQYAQKYSEEAGWETNYSGGNYQALKGVETDDGTRYVCAIFGLSEGEFLLQAYDPFYYEFPGALLEELAYNYFGSEEEIPAVEADYFEFDEENMAVYCHTENSEIVGSYKGILEDASWVVAEEPDEDGYYFAESPEGRFDLYFGYDESYGDMDIFLYPLSRWNGGLITEFQEYYIEEFGLDTEFGYRFGKFDVPAYPSAAGQYQFLESSYNTIYIMFDMPEGVTMTATIYNTTADEAEDYVTNILPAAGWEVNAESGSATFEVVDQGEAKIEFTYNEQYSAFQIQIYAYLDVLPGMVWPAEEIAAQLGEEVTDVLPAFDNGVKYALNEGYVVITIEPSEEYKVEDAVAEYIKALEDAKFSFWYTDSYGDSMYLSENKQIYANVYAYDSSTLTVSFGLAPEFIDWPTAEIAAKLGEGVTDVLPALESANYYALSGSLVSAKVAAYYATKAEAEAAQTEYAGILLAAGYTEAGADSYGDMHYASPNGQFDVCPWVSSSTLVIDIELPAPEAWPTSAIASALAELGINDVLPELPGGSAWNVAGATSYSDAQVYVDFASSADAAAASTGYPAILTEAGWTDGGVDNWGDALYLSPNGEMAVNCWTSGVRVIIEIYVVD